MRVPYMVGALLTATLITGCQTSTAADEEAIRELERYWEDATNSRDAVALAAYYTEDAVLMQPNEAVLEGWNAIRASVEEDWESGLYSDDARSVVNGVEVSGDLAVARGSWTGTTNPADGQPFQDRGYWMGIYRRQDDGSWAVAWAMWNSALPPR